jgi:transposase
MSEATLTPCPQCQILQQQLRALQQQVQTLQATIDKLQTQLAAKGKNSSTSSKPPSSDIVKPAAASTASPRAAGGQPGHPHHQRALFPPEALNGGSHDHQLPACPCCGHELLSLGTPPRVVQQVDIQDVPLHIEEHRSFAGWCPQCAAVQQAPLPIGIERGGLVGPRLTTLIAYLKGACHASFSTIRKFLRDVVGVTLSRGQLSKVVGKVGAALEQPYEELLSGLKDQAVLNVDETGHKDNGERWWTWCFRASLYTLFKIDPTRSGDVLLAVLGEEFDGVLGCDYFSAYRRYMRECHVAVQFCLAHLIREVRFLTTLPGVAERAYGERLLAAFKELFGVIHRRESLSAAAFAGDLAAARRQVLRVGTENVPRGKHSENLAARFRKHGESYFRFVTTPGVEPTNNLAEQAIRFVVIDRHITQGTRSEGGRQWCERIWTVIATCVQQGRSVFEYLHQAVMAHFAGTAAPSLLVDQ